jgi:hypothetical protein
MGQINAARDHRDSNLFYCLSNLGNNAVDWHVSFFQDESACEHSHAAAGSQASRDTSEYR